MRNTRIRSKAPHLKASGPLRLDHAALRRALGGRSEVIEVLESARGQAKASGRPGANVGVLWRYFTSSVYTSGDLPVLATRETLQNSSDAIKAAIRQRQISKDEGRFEVIWDARGRKLTWIDNGQGKPFSQCISSSISYSSRALRPLGP